MHDFAKQKKLLLKSRKSEKALCRQPYYVEKHSNFPRFFGIFGCFLADFSPWQCTQYFGLQSIVVLYTTFQALSWLNLLKALAHILCGLHAKMQTVLASPSHKKGFGSIMAFIICRCELKVYEGEKEKGVLTNGVTHCFSKACHILSELLFGGLGCMMKELCASFFLHHHQCDICRVYNDFLFLHSTHATSVISFTTSSSPNESNSANFL